MYPALERDLSTGHGASNDTMIRAETIGWRQVSHPGIFAAEEYIHQQALAIQELAASGATGADTDVRVEVTVERFSGGIAMDFFKQPITNTFRNLSCVSWYGFIMCLCVCVIA